MPSINIAANGSGYVQWRIRGRFSVGTTKKIERESDLHPPPKPPWHIAVVKHWRFSWRGNWSPIASMVWRSLWPKHHGSIQPATGFKTDYFFEDRYTARRISSIPLWLYCQVSSKNGSPFYSKNTEPGCRTATAVQRLWQTICPGGRKIIPILKAPKVAQRTKAVLIS